MNVKSVFKGAVMVSMLVVSKGGYSQSIHELRLPIEGQVSIRGSVAGVGYASTTWLGTTNALKPFTIPAIQNNGHTLRKTGKIMMITGGALYLLGAMVGTTYGEGNLETGTYIAVAGGLAFATGVPLYIIGRHRMRHAY